MLARVVPFFQILLDNLISAWTIVSIHMCKVEISVKILAFSSILIFQSQPVFAQRNLYLGQSDASDVFTMECCNNFSKVEIVIFGPFFNCCFISIFKVSKSV